MPPSARVIEDSASVVARDFDGETLDWLVALVEIPACKRPIFWMRPLDSRFDAGFVVFETTYHQMMPMERKTENFALRASLSAVCKNNKLARHFFLNKNGELRKDGEAAHEAILVAPDGLAAWSLAAVNNQLHDASTFEWNTPLSNADFVHLSACDVWNRVRNLLGEPDSDGLFARRFALMSERERCAMVFKEVRRTEDEMKELLLTLLTWQDVWHNVPEGEQLTLYVYLYGTSSLNWEDGWREMEVDASPLLEEDVTRLWNWFQPMNENLGNRHCLKEWLKSNTSNLRTSTYVSAFRPTAHEQLEANLRWRGWKARHESEKL